MLFAYVMSMLTVTFGEVAGRYASTVLAKKDCRPATRKYQASSLRMLQRVWKGLAGKKVQSITPADCRKWFDLRSIQVVAQRLNTELSLLKQVLELARREGVIAVNPAASLRGVRAEVNMARGIPTREHFEKLIVMLTLLRLHKAGLYAEFLAYSGLRPAEAAALTWGDIDFKRNEFTVSTGQRGSDKRLTRCVPLFPNLREHLLKVKERSPRSRPKDRIFRTKQCRAALSSASHLAFIPHMNHQRLRHFFAVNALRAGVDYPLLADWLGHKDGGVGLLKMYGHVHHQDPKVMAGKMTFRVRLEGSELERAMAYRMSDIKKVNQSISKLFREEVGSG